MSDKTQRQNAVSSLLNDVSKMIETLRLIRKHVNHSGNIGLATDLLDTDFDGNDNDLKYLNGDAGSGGATKINSFITTLNSVLSQAELDEMEKKAALITKTVP